MQFILSHPVNNCNEARHCNWHNFAFVLNRQNKRSMQKIIRVILFSVAVIFSTGIYAQQNHFIYIENEEHKPFIVSVNGKTFNSSDIGHVILSKLTDGKYNLNISFSENKTPAQNFTCEINKKDLGFSLKNIPASGWVLVDLTTNKINLSNTEQKGSELSGLQENNNNNNGAFGDMLSQVVNDTALVKNNVVAQPEPAKEVKVETAEDKSLQASIDSAMNEVDKTFDAAADQVDTAKENMAVDTVASVTAVPILQEVSQPQSKEETSSVQVDSTMQQDNVTTKTVDTATEIFVPSDSAKSEISNPFFQKKTETAENGNVPVISNETKTPNQDAVTQTQTVPNNEAVKTAETNNEQPVVTTSAIYKPDCKGLIKDDELEKIKRKMFVQDSNSEMVQTCLKLSGDRCFTTEQVKKLGGLFLSDDGRYTLFDALYDHVYDKGNYSTLGSQIIDSYYRKRFDAMLLK